MQVFSQQIINWQKVHGRHHLPWQNTTDPYAIWVSEIMLQQTQVAAVIGYYAKFMQRFPTITLLANATQEEVLQHWSGLGYYSRARNLHSAAQTIERDFAGVFPQHFDDIVSLAGIGRTTAAAISTFALGSPYPILDGNVKRVFARHFNVAGYTGAPKVAQLLWQIATRENPASENKRTEAITYTQGLMDLGAMVCTRSKPKCSDCPVNNSCQALLYHLTKTLPTPKPRKTLPEKSTTMLVLIDRDEVMLVKRPPIGIWGGLWSLPEVVDSASISAISSDITSLSHTAVHHKVINPHDPQSKILDKLTHVFTHFKLHITPQLIFTNKNSQVNQAAAIWLPIDEALNAAIPTPVRKILMMVKKDLTKS